MDKEFYQLTFNAIDSAILVIDDSECILAINPAFLKLLNQNTLSQDDFVGKDLFSHPVLATNNLSENYQQLLSGEANTITNVVISQSQNVNDTYLNIHIHPYTISDTQTNAYLLIHDNVTELVAANNSTIIANDLLNEIQEVSGFGWWDLDIPTQKATWSKQLFKILEYDSDVINASSEKFLERIHPDDKEIVITALNKPFKDNAPYVSEFRILLPDGKIRYVSEHGRVIFDEQGNGVHYLGTTLDITHRVEAEKEIIKQRDSLQNLTHTLELRVKQRTEELALKIKEISAAQSIAEQASQAKSNFLSSMSHELRTPLNAILGFSQLIEIDTKDEKTRNNSQEIINAGNHLLSLINEILDLSKIESGNIELSIEKYCLNEILNSTLTLINPLAEKYSIHIDNMVSTSFNINVDEMRFKQVLLNILSNAIKYNSENGKVIIDCSSNDKNMLCLSISDTGDGLTPEQLSILFEPFERLGAENTNIEGVGLGLNISKDLIELMGGTITVESTVGKGSSFLIHVSLS